VKEMQILIQNFSHLKLETVLPWGTLNGAKALGIDSIYGSFDPGKKPGVIRITGFDDADRTEIHLMT
jgi:imidazolonepropionase-like amidohydrolase